MPTTTHAIEGESVTFKCQATHLMGLEYTWTYNGMYTICFFFNMRTYAMYMNWYKICIN